MFQYFVWELLWLLQFFKSAVFCILLTLSCRWMFIACLFDVIVVLFSNDSTKNIFFVIWVIPCQIIRWSHGWHLRFYYHLNHRKLSWRKYYPENFNFILHMVQKLLLYEFCQRPFEIAFNQLQTRFSQLYTHITHQRKFWPPVAFHPNKSFLSSASIENAWFWS